MNDFRLRSKEYLGNELKDIIHDLYVTALDRAEKILKPDRKSESWQHFRFEILNMGNQCIRRTDEVLSEYSVEFRPPIFSVEYKEELPNIDKLAVFEFKIDGIHPSFRIHMGYSENTQNTLEDIQELLGCGKIVEGHDSLSYIVDGMYDCFHKVIPFFIQKSAFKGQTLEKFILWREQVYQLEAKGTGNAKETT